VSAGLLGVGMLGKQQQTGKPKLQRTLTVFFSFLFFFVYLSYHTTHTTTAERRVEKHFIICL